MGNFKKNVGEFWSKHGSLILTIGSVAGSILTPILAARAAPRAQQKIEDIEYQRYREDPENYKSLNVVQHAAIVWKDYAPAVAVGALGIGCTIGAHVKDQKTIAGLSTAYNIAVGSAELFEKNVKEAIPKADYEKIKEKTAEDKEIQQLESGQASKSVVAPVLDDNNSWYKEPWTKQFIRTDMERLRRVENDIRDQLSLYGEDVCINDWLDALGLEHTEIGYDIGWKASKDGTHDLFRLRVDYPNAGCEGTPYAVISFVYEPKSLR